jgi:hypothetical protein
VKTSVMMTVFWDVALCSLVEIDGRFAGAYCFHHQSDDRPDDGGGTHLCNISQFLPDYTAQHPRRLPIGTEIICSQQY